MMMVEKETSIMTGKKTGDLAEIAMLTRKKGEGVPAGNGQEGTVSKAEKLIKMTQPSS